MANLELLGIDSELLQAMEAERSGRAPWVRSGYDEGPVVTLRQLNCESKREYRPKRKTLAVKAQPSKEIPISQPATGGRRLYPFAEMRVGQYFFAANKSGDDTRRTADSITSCARYASRKYGFKFKTRRAVNGVQVWRIA